MLKLLLFGIFYIFVYIAYKILDFELTVIALLAVITFNIWSKN